MTVVGVSSFSSTIILIKKKKKKKECLILIILLFLIVLQFRSVHHYQLSSFLPIGMIVTTTTTTTTTATTATISKDETLNNEQVAATVGDSFPNRIQKFFEIINRTATTTTSLPYYRHHPIMTTTIATKDQDDNDIDKDEQIDNDNNMSWIKEYIIWHNEMRQKFPGYTIVTHPNAPKILIMITPPQNNNGLTDRVQDIYQILQFAYKEQRILFLKWFNCPMNIETFLIPNLFNWTVPLPTEIEKEKEESKHHSPTTTTTTTTNSHNNHNHPNEYQMFLKDTLHMTEKELINFTNIENSIQYRNGTIQSNSIRIRPFLSCNPPLGTFPINNNQQQYHIYWYIFFQPSQLVQTMIQQTMKDLQLIPYHYDALHIRIGHPGFYNKKKYFSKYHEELDRYSSSNNGSNGDSNGTTTINKLQVNPIQCLNSTIHAIQCSKWLAATTQVSTSSTSTTTTTTANDNNDSTRIIPILYGNNNNNKKKKELKIFFYSDSQHLTDLIVDPNSFVPFSNRTDIIEQQKAHERLLDVLHNNINTNTTTEEEGGSSSIALHMVARRNARPTHLGGSDTTTNYNGASNPTYSTTIVEGYANTFVDLYIASQARCINFGVGRFAYLAAKISGTSCWTHHSHIPAFIAKAWGLKEIVQEVPQCPLL